MAKPVVLYVAADPDKPSRTRNLAQTIAHSAGAEFKAVRTEDMKSMDPVPVLAAIYEEARLIDWSALLLPKLKK